MPCYVSVTLWLFQQQIYPISLENEYEVQREIPYKITKNPFQNRVTQVGYIFHPCYSYGNSYFYQRCEVSHSLSVFVTAYEGRGTTERAARCWTALESGTCLPHQGQTCFQFAQPTKTLKKETLYSHQIHQSNFISDQMSYVLELHSRGTVFIPDQNTGLLTGHDHHLSNLYLSLIATLIILSSHSIFNFMFERVYINKDTPRIELNLFFSECL